ncbi:unnamed protein product [Paramecium octaurelia]|uniref:Uncharacterized protein n=1 Tax=Paramecium octaurelia TaxID=43137 RepID=A0A8S1TCE1_PAROT|nr:unnamed protein product [Paramecium octaurelia]
MNMIAQVDRNHKLRFVHQLNESNDILGSIFLVQSQSQRKKLLIIEEKQFIHCKKRDLLLFNFQFILSSKSYHQRLNNICL